MLIHKIYSILIVSILMVSGASSYSKADAASYGYDRLSRVTRADYDSGFTEEYAYDPAGNRLTLNVTSKWISGYGHTSPDIGETAELSVEIRASSPATGRFTYNNTSAGIDISGTSVMSLTIDGNSAVIIGGCIFNGISGYYYTAALTDGPDTLKIEIYDPDGTLSFITDTDKLSDGGLVIETDPSERYELTTSISPPGGGSLSPDCSGGCVYDNGTAVTVTAERNSGYAFMKWNGCDSALNNICVITMDTDRIANALFTSCSGPVRLDGTEYFSDPQEAYDASQDGSSIEMQDILFSGGIYFDRNVSVRLQGGFDCTYGKISGNTTILEGSITVSNGTVTIGDITLK